MGQVQTCYVRHLKCQWATFLLLLLLAQLLIAHMAVEKCHHQRRLVPYKPCFNFAIQSATRLDFSCQIQCQIRAKRKQVCQSLHQDREEALVSLFFSVPM